MDFLKNYYASFGHRATQSVPTLQTVLQQEHEYPNSIIDAKRLVGIARKLTANGGSTGFLDVGCGYGFFSKEALDAGFKVSALEIASNERGIAHEMAGLSPVACSFEDFQNPYDAFEVILLSQILEHAFDVNFWIDKCRTLLVDNGIVAIALPNYGSLFRIVMQSNDPFICPPTHLNFFNRRSLTTLLRNHGFRVEKTEWVSRIPFSAFEKRTPFALKSLSPIVGLLSTLTLSALDFLRLGMMLRVYARKV